MALYKYAYYYYYYYIQRISHETVSLHGFHYFLLSYVSHAGDVVPNCCAFEKESQ